MRFLFVLFSMILLTGCRTSSIAIATPTIPQLTGTVTIDFPITGALVYSELIQVAGTAADLPANTFELTFTGPDEIELARSTIPVVDGHWQVELPHTYQAVPIEVTITAHSTNEDITTPYDIVLIALGGLDYRPEGTFGSITFPTNDSTVGGDSVQIEGLASGLEDNSLTIQLVNSENQIISEQAITTYNPYFVDEMPWSAEIILNGYTGPAQLEMTDSSGIVLSTINLHVEATAG